MAYTKQNFQDGQILYASSLNKMDDELVRLGTDKVNNADIINNLTSTDTTKPLSAAQGKVLNESKVNKTDIINNLTSTDTDKPLSAAQGKALNDNKVNTSDIVDNLTSSDVNKPLSANQGKKLNEEKVSIVDIKDNLISTDTNKPLSANQGKALDEKKINYIDIKDDLTSTDTNKPLSANQGKVLNESKVNISDVQDTLESTDKDKPLSANQGNILNKDVVNNTNAVIESTYKQWNRENPINDCKENLIKGIKLYGKSYQKSYSGKNLVNVNDFKNKEVDSKNIFNFTLNEYLDDSFINGITNTTISSIGRFAFTFIKLDTFNRLCFKHNGANNDIVIFIDVSHLQNDTKYAISFNVLGYNPSIIDGLSVSNIQIELGETATDYEPYVGGIPSPNPSYPQEIQSVVNPKLTVCGKNLLNPTLETTTRNGVTCTNNGDGTYTLNGTASSNEDFIVGVLSPDNKTYKITGCPSGGSKSTYMIDVTNLVDNAQKDTGNGNEITLSGNNEYKCIITIKSGVTFNNLIFKPMIYEAYKEQTATLPYTLNAIPVSSGGNVTIDGQQYIADYVDIENKHLVRMVGEYTVKGNNSWFIYSDTNIHQLSIKFLNLNGVPYSSCYSNIAPYGVNANNRGDYLFGTYLINNGNGLGIQLYGIKDTVPDVNAFIEFAKSNPIHVYYHLATPTITDLTDEEVQAFKSLHTYYPTTNIINSSDVLSGACDLKYLYNTSTDDIVKLVNDNKTDADNKFNDINTTLTTLDTNKLSIFDTAGFHNSIVRGKDITSYYTDGTLWDRIAGTNGFRPYEDLYLGDYFKMSRPISAYEQTQQYQTTGSQYVTIAGFDCMRNNGDSGVINFNHITCVPGQFRSGSFHFGRSRMNPTDTTTGGYIGSEMNTTTIGAVATEGSTEATATINQQLYAEFGSHLKTSRELLSSAINASGYNRFGTNRGCSNEWKWQSCQAVLMSEVEVYGATVWSSSGFDTGNACMQLPLFAKDKACISNRSAWYWLKDVATASLFCSVGGDGYAYYSGAGNASVYVRPRFNLA